MPISLSDYLNIDPNELKKRNVFDTILDSDSLFFINFMRLKDTETPELTDSYIHLQKFFDKIGVLLDSSPDKSHRFYKEAYNLFVMTEFEEICLGYSLKSTAGSGSGSKLKSIILNTAFDIIKAGNKHPEIFEIVGLFEENIGPDRISDMISRVIKEDLINYSKRIYLEIRPLVKNLHLYSFVDGLLINPYNSKSLILLPKDILHELPVASQWEDIDYVCSINHEVRSQLNENISKQWAELSTKDKKAELRKLLLKDKRLFQLLIQDYKKEHLDAYDFEVDPKGEAIWYSYAKDYTSRYPLTLKRKIINKSELIHEVHLICDHFKELIENNGLNEILYDSNGKARRERITQKLFFGIATTYCKVNNSDINPEVNSGRGPLDFKFSIGNMMKVLVEIKLATNPQLIHGYKKQLVEYQKGERTDDSVYLVIDNGGNEQRVKSLFDLHNDQIAKGHKTHHLVVVDGNPKASASRI